MTKGLSYELVKLASDGDAEAVGKILKIYEPYINTLASIDIYGSDGEKYIGIDVELRDRLRTKLIEVILKFDVA